ncbi:ABC transporter permease [Acidovorax sp. Leaf160]|uniref:ABC transporter permease n=1 Tax=Acidovorax sp. Leaf160 TaxID=1736280 RepID=UPI0006F5B6F0|nr:ABC transporter permease [Acidovorax sp. Leaf160]KQR63306.1 sugar ABC transporter permease [Acidovorax sp. Leaf160]
MQEFSATPREMFLSMWRNRDLIAASAKREILGRYRGSAMGIMWSLFNPVFMLVIYTFVFSVIFKARWTAGGESKTEFALVLFVGLIIFNIFSECVSRAPTFILSNVNYVKKVVFPLEILPFVGLLAALFHGVISIGVWLAAYIIFFGIPHATFFYLPLILFPLALFVVGLSWLLSSLGVYLRDVGQFVGIIIAVLMFMSPIFYPITSLPENYRHLLYLNPLTGVIEQARAILYFGNNPDFKLLAGYWGASFALAWIGFAWFQKTRKGFSDVL